MPVDNFTGEGHCFVTPAMKSDTLPCLNSTCLKCLKIENPEKCFVTYQMKAIDQYNAIKHKLKGNSIFEPRNYGIFYLVFKMVNHTADSKFSSNMPTFSLKIHMK